MATILALKRRIKTGQNVAKSTRAMQMIAASRLRRAQEAATLGKPYVEKLSKISQNLSARIENDHIHQYMKVNEKNNKKLIIAVSPDKGLTGALVSNLLREVSSFSTSKEDYYIVIGKKAENTIVSMGKNVIASFPFGTTLPAFDTVYPIIKIVDEYFLTEKVSEVKIISTKFTAVFSQTPTVTDILPIKLSGETSGEDRNIMLFEPNLSELLPSLLQHYLEMVIYQSLLENYASEQASRMIAMKNATDNALDLIEELKLEYNKSRQEKITNEILDISSASFAYAN